MVADAIVMQQRFIFRCDPADAREAAVALMDGYTDVIRADPEARRALGILPDTITHLPQFCGIASIDALGQRQRPFAFWTLPTPVDDEAIARRRAAQREREVGGLRPHFPPDLAGVQGILAPQGVRYDTGTHQAPIPAQAAQVDGSRRPLGQAVPGGRSGQADGSSPPESPGQQLTLAGLAPGARELGGGGPGRGVAAGDARDGPSLIDPAHGPSAGARANTPARGSSRGEVASDSATSPAAGQSRDALGRPIGAPESYAELDRLREGAWHWEAQEVLARAERGSPTRRQAEIMGLLCEAPLLLQSQIERELGLSETQALRTLAPMRRSGWVKRCRPRENVPHGVPWVYALTAAGARALGDLGLSHPAAKGWREPSPEDLERRRWVPAHDAGAAAWVFALRRALGRRSP